MSERSAVPFFRVEIDDAEIEEVTAVLRSGWLTTGPRVHRFESEFVARLGSGTALAVSSCTAALHLAVEALGLRRGQAVLVPTMTFAASAEVVGYCGAVPILVDCEEQTLLMDLEDARRKLRAAREGSLPGCGGDPLEVVGVIVVHVAGLMVDFETLSELAVAEGLWVVEDAAHAFPASRCDRAGRWVDCGNGTGDVTCFSFYANKTITTGEGGMAVCADDSLADRMRLMALHGLSRDAWQRYREGGSWDYRIVAPGFKYNLSDIAAAIGIHQLRRADELRAARAAVARRYYEAFSDEPGLELPPDPAWARQSWHLFAVRLREERLSIGRDRFIDELREAGIGTSVHWRPLHLHPYYADELGWRPEHCPVAARVWRGLVSLPLFPSMRSEEIDLVVAEVSKLLRRHARAAGGP